MKRNGNFLILALAAAATLAASDRGLAATIPVTGWAAHNGASTAGGTPSAPTFTPGDNLTLMAPFDNVSLANDGEYVEVTTTLDLNNRTANLGVNSLNTQLRAGVFDGPAGAIVASDIPNFGYTIEYTNQPAGGLIREQESASQANPFTSPTSRGNGAAPTGSIQGANPDPVTFTIRMTRNGGALDLSGSIVSAAFTGNFALAGTSSAHFPLNGTFNFNRIGLFLGANVDATDAVLTNTSVTTNVPEPCGLLLAAGVFGGVLMSRSRRRAS
jgi:hypothetical protein